MKTADYLEYFMKRPDSYEKIVAEFDRTKTLFDYLRDSGVVDSASTILSIGAGDGEVEIRLAKEMGRQIGIIEPSPDYFERFTANAFGAGVRDQVIEARQQTLQDFQAHPSYDLVLSLFSWFAFGLDRELLEKALSSLAPTGQLLICLPEEVNPLTKISVASRPSEITLTSDGLSSWAKSEGFDHRYDVYHGVVPAARFLASGRLTERGKDLVAFVAARSWAEVTEDVRSTALGSLVEANDGELIDFRSGCLIFDIEQPRRREN